MSLYNALFGYDLIAHVLLRTLGIEVNVVERFRDCYAMTSEGGVVIRILTRTGAAIEANMHLRQHPLYVSDAPDSFDGTYREFTFQVPSDLPTLPCVFVHTDTAMERFQKLIGKMNDGVDLKVGSGIMDQILGAQQEGATHVRVQDSDQDEVPDSEEVHDGRDDPRSA